MKPDIVTGDLRIAASADEVLASHFTLVSQPGAIETLEVEGAAGWTSSNPHPVLSLMRWTTSDKEVAAAALEEIIKRFRADQRGFDWMTGPREENLTPLLYERGFLPPPLDVAAMAMEIPSDYHAPDPDGIRIAMVDDATDMRFSDIMSAGFDVTNEVGAIYHRAYMTPSPLQQSVLYGAWLDDTETPVGVGYLSYIGDGPAVLMRVSSTLTAFRGRGVYRALVQRRLAEAARQGRKLAFVHAYSETSQNALAEMGFKIVGELQLHRWRP